MGRKKGTTSTLWMHKEGGRGHTVWVQERTPGGNLYVRWRDRGQAQWQWECLGHTDRDAALEHAADLAHTLRMGREAVATGDLAPVALFALYEAAVTDHKKGEQPAEDRRRMDVWQAFFDARGIQDVRELDEDAVQEFTRQRRAGALVVPGRQLRANPSDTTIGADIVFLQSVLNWAVKKRVRGPGGKTRRLLESNPLTGIGVLRSKNPRRLWATYDWYLAVRPHCDEPKPIDRQELFGDFLDLMESLGWRVTALCELRLTDLRLVASEDAPHGWIHKRGEVDKEDVDEWIPLPRAAREAIDRLVATRSAIGDVALFPAPKSKERECWTRQYVGQSLERLVKRTNAARRAQGLEEIPYVNPHAFRRKWEEERRHLPLKDRMDASGRRDERSLNRSYLRRDVGRVLQVLEEPRKLRGGMVLTG